MTVKLLRFLDKDAEDERMELRLAVDRAHAHAEDLRRYLINNKEDLAQSLSDALNREQ